MNINSIVKFVTKNKITLAAVLAFAVAFGCIFAFAGNNSESPDVSSESASAPVVSDANDSDNLLGNGIFVDGVFVSAASDATEANSALASILSDRVALLAIDSDEVSFAGKVEVLEGVYPANSFVDIKNLVNYGDGSLTDYSGNKLEVKLSVRSVSTYTENVVVEHDIKTVYTDAVSDGATKVLTKGYNGEGIETHSVISVDGVEVDRNVSLEVTTAPVTKVVRVGTRTNGKYTQSLGMFKKPYDGFITSYFGSRWGRNHNGIDIVEKGGDCFRDPAYAAGKGVVIMAEYHGGYGNCVVIDHGNGIHTYYAHLDKIMVSVGDKLVAGDTVGLIGSTGNSTGPHLHFEVHVDGEKVNPLLFVDYE